MSARSDAWKDETLVRTYLDGIRGAIPLAAEQIETMLRLIDAGGLAVRSFLDLGCGGGALAAALLERYPRANATLVDFSAPMLVEARERLAPFGTQCRFLHGDLSSRDWLRDDGSQAPYDAAVSGYAIHHLTDDRKRALYGEVFDLLRPGALFLNIEHVSSPGPWLANVFDAVMTDSLYAYQRSTGSNKTRDEVADEYVHRPDKHANILASVESQCDWLRALGYQEVDCYFKVFELAVFGGRKP